MSLPADDKPENEAQLGAGKEPEAAKKPEATEASKAIAPAASSPVNPFLAAAAEDRPNPAAPDRSFFSRALDYSAHAAIIVGLVGVAWTVSARMMDRPAAEHAASASSTSAAATPAAMPGDELAQLRLTSQKMHDDIKALKASVDSLRTVVRHDTTPEQVRMLSAGLDSLKSGIGTTNEAISQLNGKLEKLQPNKLQALNERVTRLEHETMDSAATGSIGRPQAEATQATRSDAKAAAADTPRVAPKPPAKPTSLASADDTANHAADKPQVITGWVVRGVYQGVALVEGKRGSMEVVPGVNIPGAGVVKSIERHGNGWTVTTTKGQVASAAPERDYRRNPYQRDMYSPYRYDY